MGSFPGENGENLCGKRYTDPSSLRKHIITDHGVLTWIRAQHNKTFIDQQTPKKRRVKVTNKDEPKEVKDYDYGSIHGHQKGSPVYMLVWPRTDCTLKIPTDVENEWEECIAQKRENDRADAEFMETLRQTYQHDVTLIGPLEQAWQTWIGQKRKRTLNNEEFMQNLKRNFDVPSQLEQAWKKWCGQKQEKDRQDEEFVLTLQQSYKLDILLMDCLAQKFGRLDEFNTLVAETKQAHKNMLFGAWTEHEHVYLTSSLQKWINSMNQPYFSGQSTSGKLVFKSDSTNSKLFRFGSTAN